MKSLLPPTLYCVVLHAIAKDEAATWFVAADALEQVERECEMTLALVARARAARAQFREDGNRDAYDAALAEIHNDPRNPDALTLWNWHFGSRAQIRFLEDHGPNAD